MLRRATLRLFVKAKFEAKLQTSRKQKQRRNLKGFAPKKSRAVRKEKYGKSKRFEKLSRISKFFVSHLLFAILALIMIESCKDSFISLVSAIDKIIKRLVT